MMEEFTVHRYGIGNGERLEQAGVIYLYNEGGRTIALNFHDPIGYLRFASTVLDDAANGAERYVNRLYEESSAKGVDPEQAATK